MSQVIMALATMSFCLESCGSLEVSPKGETKEALDATGELPALKGMVVSQGNLLYIGKKVKEEEEGEGRRESVSLSLPLKRRFVVSSKPCPPASQVELLKTR